MHVNNSCCQERDRNLAGVRLLSTFDDIGRGLQFAKVVILALSDENIEMLLALQYSVVHSRYAYANFFGESILSLTFDPE